MDKAKLIYTAMKCQIENIKDTIAKEYGFNSWDQYFEYFITTKPGRKVLRSGIRKVLWEVLLLSNDLLSCPKCILKNYDSKELNIMIGERCYNLRLELHKMKKNAKQLENYTF
jgi:hypothetical protein